jgi:acylphosphatase
MHSQWLEARADLMKRNYLITVTGKVQGVFYRASAQQKAIELDLTGFAQNQPDGSVLIEAEGEEANLNQLVAWCKTGPPRAVVTDVHVEISTIKHYSEFSIKR